MKTLKQRGFSVVEIVLIVAVVAVIGLVGFVVYSRQQDSKAGDAVQTETTQSSTADDVDSAPEIQSEEDLNKAEAVLDGTDVEGSNQADSRMIDNQTGDF